ncbi:MAG TPA: tetratricopeptide repeat protein [bacterium]|nr:tetratricopeptide repeat protein [bacterium]
MSPAQPPDAVPPEITFIALPEALAQFHHLPSHVPVWVHREKEAKAKGYDFEEGAHVMEELLRAAPRVPGAYLFQLFVKKWAQLKEVQPLIQARRVAEAIPALVKILDLDPECPLTCFQLAYCFRKTGELEKAESLYLKAARLAPQAGWIYTNLGRTYQGLGQASKAVEAYWRALELLPGDLYVMEQLVDLGELYASPGAVEEGRPQSFLRRVDYEKSMNQQIDQKKDAPALMELGWRLLQEKLANLAVRAFEKARQFPDAGAEPLLGLGVARLSQGQYREAEDCLVRFLDEHPESPTAHLNLFKVYLALEELDLAWDEIQTAVRLDPDRLEALQQLFFFFEQTQREEEGLQWMDKLCDQHPRSFAPLLVKAQYYVARDHWAQAEAMLLSALKRSPRNEAILIYYSAELGKRGLNQAIVDLLESQEGTLSFALTINLSLAYRNAGKFSESQTILKNYLKTPGLPPVVQQRAQVILRELEKETP